MHDLYYVFGRVACSVSPRKAWLSSLWVFQDRRSSAPTWFSSQTIRDRHLRIGACVCWGGMAALIMGSWQRQNLRSFDHRDHNWVGRGGTWDRCSSISCPLYRLWKQPWSSDHAFAEVDYARSLRRKQMGVPLSLSSCVQPEGEVSHTTIQWVLTLPRWTQGVVLLSHHIPCFWKKRSPARTAGRGPLFITLNCFCQQAVSVHWKVAGGYNQFWI